MGSTDSPHDGHAVAVNCWFACVSLLIFAGPPPLRRWIPTSQAILTREVFTHSSLVYLAFVVFCACQVSLGFLRGRGADQRGLLTASSLNRSASTGGISVARSDCRYQETGIASTRRRRQPHAISPLLPLNLSRKPILFPGDEPVVTNHDPVPDFSR